MNSIGLRLCFLGALSFAVQACVTIGTRCGEGDVVIDNGGDGGQGGEALGQSSQPIDGWFNVCATQGPFGLSCANNQQTCPLYGACCKSENGLCISRCLSCCDKDTETAELRCL